MSGETEPRTEPHGEPAITAAAISALCRAIERPVVVTDDSQRITEVNEAASRWLQCGSAALVGRSIWDALERVGVSDLSDSNRKLRFDRAHNTTVHRTAIKATDPQTAGNSEPSGPLQGNTVSHIAIGSGSSCSTLWLFSPTQDPSLAGIPLISPSLAIAVAHDVNGALSIIRNYSSVALCSSQDAEVRENLNHVLSATSRAAEILQQLATGWSNVAPPVRVASAVQDSLQLLQLSRPAEVDLSTTVEIGSKLETRCSAAQWHELILNLGWNAFVASRDLPCSVSINISEFQALVPVTCLHNQLPSQNYVLLEVSDRGCGFQLENIPRMFEPFISTAKGENAGSGVGLYVVRCILEVLHGGIQVLATQPRGTVIRVYIPVFDERHPDRDDG
ncbi:MAG: ATP-binding protein [Planctomycetota bacterium]|nr:ATP-binding protein [Planctomycetota bacterium]MDA1177276.1 ATP-binding protein [Planctomycetota bacterium]